MNELMANTSPEREALKKLQATLATCDTRIDSIPVIHHFADGVYGRECFIERGQLIAGRIHKTEHINVISQGHVDVVVDNVITGEIVKTTYEAPCVFVAPAGTKRMIFANEDTIWTTFHKYHGEQDGEKMADIMTWFDYDNYNAEMLLMGAECSPRIKGE